MACFFKSWIVLMTYSQCICLYFVLKRLLLSLRDRFPNDIQSNIYPESTGRLGSSDFGGIDTATLPDWKYPKSKNFIDGLTNKAYAFLIHKFDWWGCTTSCSIEDHDVKFSFWIIWFLPWSMVWPSSILQDQSSVDEDCGLARRLWIRGRRERRIKLHSSFIYFVNSERINNYIY